MNCLSLCSGAVQVSVLLGYCAAWIDDCCVTCWDILVVPSSTIYCLVKSVDSWWWNHHPAPNCQAPITQWCSAIFQTYGNLILCRLKIYTKIFSEVQRRRSCHCRMLMISNSGFMRITRWQIIFIAQLFKNKKGRILIITANKMHYFSNLFW
jgi:hypothetical protein